VSNEENSVFQEGDVISTYTDREAIEDGIIVAINPRDRVTRTVWEWLVEKQPKDSQPPNCWPVGMMGWFRAAAMPKSEAVKIIAEHGAEEGQRIYERMVRDRKAHALSIGLVDHYRDQARRIYDENTNGGIFKLQVQADGEQIRGIDPLGDIVLWLLPNENGGISLMFPEDY
jgi:hypothetical protein